MSALAILSTALTVAFAALASWTIVQWVRQRSRASALLASAITSLAIAIALSRLDSLTTVDLWTWVTLTLNVILIAFPWVLAASVWSLGGAWPRWWRIGLIGVPTLSVWLAFAPVLPGSARQVEELLLLATLGVLWTIAAVGTAVRLRRAAGRYVLARPRMRLMAMGLIVLNLALLLDLLTITTGSPTLRLVMNAVAVVGATTLLLGFLAPRPLRWWWWRATMPAFQQMQAELLASLSHEDVARAVAPRLAELLGGAVIVLDGDGMVLERSGIGEQAAHQVAERVATGVQRDVGVRAVSIGHGWLVVVANPFTPLFGQEEDDLLDAYAAQMRIAADRAQLFETIAIQQQDLEAMLLGLAHDIRSPTAIIHGFVELLVDTDDRDERQELAEHVAASTAYLDRLVDAMMELGQVRSSEDEREPVELGAVARQVAQRVQAAHPDARIEVAEGGGVVIMSPVRAEQLFDNLLTNAIKHGGRRELHVTVEVVTLAPEGVQVVVADDGVGIGPDDRQRIFAPFQRGSNANGNGNGLGLGLVRRVVEDVGGQLTLAPSERGARFVIDLPSDGVPEDCPDEGLGAARS